MKDSLITLHIFHRTKAVENLIKFYNYTIVTTSEISIHKINPAFYIKSTSTLIHTVCTHSSYSLTLIAQTKIKPNTVAPFLFSSVQFLLQIKSPTLGQSNQYIKRIHSKEQETFTVNFTAYLDFLRLAWVGLAPVSVKKEGVLGRRE